MRQYETFGGAYLLFRLLEFFIPLGRVNFLSFAHALINGLCRSNWQTNHRENFAMRPQKIPW